MSRRAAAAAPELRGFDHVKLLGTGGFADVHLYQQHRPRRQVAVKVLLAGVRDDEARRRFDDEADLMAQLSTHPFIVTVYSADVAPDGRPFLVMEYCPHPNLGVRCQNEPFGVAEALHTGIQLAGAVETMHRAGIVHRDIKPANVLVTEYRRPALTDFGISAVSGGQGAAQGLSVPWSPPESFAAETRPGPAGDVYSLGATVYSLLSGRQPFQVPGGDNGHLAMARRIETQPLPPLNRPDVPEHLELVLATAMAKPVSGRYPTALAFARALQQVQTRLQLPLTHIEVLDDAAPVDHDDDADDGATQIRSVVTIDPDRAPSHLVAPTTTAPQPGGQGEAAVADTVRHAAARTFSGPRLATPPVDATTPRFEPAPDEPAVAQVPHAPASRGRLVAGIVAAVVLVGGGVAAAVLVGRGAPPDQAAPRSTVVAPVDVVADVVPAPAGLTGTVGPDGATFTWTNPDPADGDLFLYRVPEAATEVRYSTTADTRVTVPASDEGPTCLEVLLRRTNGRASAAPAATCVTP